MQEEQARGLKKELASSNAPTVGEKRACSGLPRYSESPSDTGCISGLCYC